MQNFSSLGLKLRELLEVTDGRTDDMLYLDVNVNYVDRWQPPLHKPIKQMFDSPSGPDQCTPFSHVDKKACAPLHVS